MAVPFTNTTDAATISTSEYFLASDSTSATYQTTACKLQVLLDLSAMQAGDEFQIKFYEKVNGGSAIAFLIANVSGAQSQLWVSPIVYVAEGWEVSLKKIAGTDRSLGWALRKDVGDTNTASMTAGVVTAAAVADNAIDAASLATDAKDLFGFLRRNTAQAGSTDTTIVLDASASAVDDIYNGAMVVIVGGTGAGQFARVTAYNGTTKVATVETAYTDSEWVTALDNTSVFVLLAWTGGSGGGSTPEDIAAAVLVAAAADPIHANAKEWDDLAIAIPLKNLSRWQTA